MWNVVRERLAPFALPTLIFFSSRVRQLRSFFSRAQIGGKKTKQTQKVVWRLCHISWKGGFWDGGLDVKVHRCVWKTLLRVKLRGWSDIAGETRDRNHEVGTPNRPQFLTLLSSMLCARDTTLHLLGSYLLFPALFIFIAIETYS